MTDLEKAARMALEALEYYQHRKIEWDYSDDAAITAIREALAEQPAHQEPVGTIEVTHHEGKIESWRFIKKPENAPAGIYDVYTSSQRKPWVGLTDDDLDDIATAAKRGNLHDLRLAIEAKLKDKNA